MKASLQNLRVERLHYNSNKSSFVLQYNNLDQKMSKHNELEFVSCRMNSIISELYWDRVPIHLISWIMPTEQPEHVWYSLSVLIILLLLNSNSSTDRQTRQCERSVPSQYRTREFGLGNSVGTQKTQRSGFGAAEEEDVE